MQKKYTGKINPYAGFVFSWLFLAVTNFTSC